MLAEAERKLANLSPATNVQRWALEEAKVIVINGIGDARWKLVVQSENTVPTALLVLLVLWLVLLFASYGLFAPRHATTMVMLLLSSAATAGAIALIIDLERPIGELRGPVGQTNGACCRRAEPVTASHTSTN